MNLSPDFSRWVQQNRWIWSAVAVAILWLILSVVTNRFSLASLSGILLSASFLTIVGLGQMFVVTTGRGNIDLSIPSVITLNAYLALLTIKGLDANLAFGLLVALGVGLLVGGFNVLLAVVLRIPAIIATLATGYVLATATLLANRQIPGFAVSPTLKTIASGRVYGVPAMALVALVCVALASFVLRYTAYGQCLAAVGQNRAAARLAGIRTNAVIASAFVISSVLASFIGLAAGGLCRGGVSGDGPTLSAAIHRRRGGRGHADLRRLCHSGWHLSGEHPADPDRDDHADHRPAAGHARHGAGRGRHPRPGACWPRRWPAPRRENPRKIPRLNPLPQPPKRRRPATI